MAVIQEDPGSKASGCSPLPAVQGPDTHRSKALAPTPCQAAQTGSAGETEQGSWAALGTSAEAHQFSEQLRLLEAQVTFLTHMEMIWKHSCRCHGNLSGQIMSPLPKICALIYFDFGCVHRTRVCVSFLIL